MWDTCEHMDFSSALIRVVTEEGSKDLRRGNGKSAHSIHGGHVIGCVTCSSKSHTSPSFAERY